MTSPPPAPSATSQTTLRTLVIDDEAPARRIMHKLLEAYCDNVFVVGEAHDLASARQAIQSYRPDLIFLDVDLQGNTGFDVLEQVDTQGAQVVFVTAYADYALQAFRVAATDYLVKPVDIEQLQAAVVRATDRHAQAASPHAGITLVLPDGDERRIVKTSEVVRIAAEGSYSTLFFADGEHLLVVRKLGQLEAELDGCGFCRVHRSHLVNLAHVTAVRKGKVLLRGGHEVPVSRSRSAEVLRSIRGRY